MDGITREDRFNRMESFEFGRFSFHGQNPDVEVSVSTCSLLPISIFRGFEVTLFCVQIE